VPEIAINAVKFHSSFDNLETWAAKSLGKDIREDPESKRQLALSTYITILIEFASMDSRDTFLVKIAPKADSTQNQAGLTNATSLSNKATGFEVLMKYSHLPLLWVQCSYEWIHKNHHDSLIKSIHGNPPIYLCVSSILERFDINLIHESFYELTGKGIIIALIDSGIDQSHPDLQNKIVDVINISDEDIGDYNGHGTYIASILVGTGKASNGFYHGVAPDARLIDVKLFNKEGSASIAELLIAFDLILNRNPPDLPQIVNLSCVSGLVGQTEDLMMKYCDLLFQRSVIVVCPAGNFGPELNSIPSPSSSIRVFTVGSIDVNNRVAFFSGRGIPSDLQISSPGKPDIVLLGSEIIAARSLKNKIGKRVTDEPQYIMLSGTSISTAVASGMLALLKQIRKDMPPSEAFSILKQQTSKISQFAHSQGSGTPKFLEILESNRLFFPKPLKYKHLVFMALKYSLVCAVLLIAAFYLF
jgi:subtilisin family serine protease